MLDSVIFLATTAQYVLAHIGLENLGAGIITFAVGVWMLSFGLLLRFNKTPGPHPMRINGYILLILSISAIIANILVLIITITLGGADVTVALVSYGIPSIIGLACSIIVMYLAYTHMIQYHNFKHKVGTNVILLGIILMIMAVINLYYYYLYLQYINYLLFCATPGTVCPATA